MVTPLVAWGSSHLEGGDVVDRAARGGGGWRVVGYPAVCRCAASSSRCFAASLADNEKALVWRATASEMAPASSDWSCIARISGSR